MARIKDIEISVELLKSRSWTPLKESDDQHSLRGINNSNIRRTSILESSPGRFRFLIRVAKTFKWGTANALRVLLTFDEGWEVKEYPVTVFKPGIDTMDMLTTPGRGVLEPSADGLKLEYTLTSIALPKNPTEAELPWFNTKFAFRKLKVDGMNTKSAAYYTSVTDLARLCVIIEPRHVYGQNTRIINLALKVREEDRYNSRKEASKRNITLETTIRQKEDDQAVDPMREILCRPIAPHGPRTFVFLYREQDQYDKIENVETMDKTKVKPRTLCQDMSPAKLPELLFDMAEMSDIENQTPKRRKPTKSSVSEPGKQHPTAARSTLDGSMPSLTGSAEPIPTPFQPDHNLGRSSGADDTLRRRCSTDAVHQLASYSSSGSTHLQREKGPREQVQEEATDFDSGPDGQSEKSESSQQAGDTPSHRNESWAAGSISGDSTLVDNPEIQIPDTPGRQILQDQPAASAIETLRDGDSIRHKFQAAQENLVFTLKGQIEDIDEKHQDITDEREELQKEFDRKMEDLKQRDEKLRKEREEAQSQLESAEAAASNDMLSEGESDKLEKANKAAEEYRAYQTRRYDKFCGSQKKTPKRPRRSLSSGSSPSGHHRTKRHAAYKA
ncbi:hypothetical protein PMZ80_002035 [Knufia obscura]|uniref:Uncharacterized protein n=1 Tax=Knufia obscura TaxID=1635080 RepID=A0ABR0RW64_9EURO|nr:hypothetical protein PMZ80_002035 [Knufia obscura]